MIRKVAIAATAALIVGAGLLLSFYLLALSAAGYLVIYVLRRLRGHRWAKVIWTLLLLVGVLVFARMRKSTVPQDCDATAKSFIGRADNGQSPGLRPEPRDAVSTSREHFQDFSRTVLAHANVAMKTERVLIDARKLLNGLIPIGESGDAATRTVSSAIDELQASWSKQKLSNTAAKKEKLNQLEKFISDRLPNLQQLNSDQIEDVESQLSDLSLEETYTKANLLQDALNRLVVTKLGQTYTPDFRFTAKVNEDPDEIVYEETINVILPDGNRLEELDLSELNDPIRPKQTPDLYLDGKPSEIKPGVDLSSVPIPEFVKKVSIVNRTAVSSQSTRSCSTRLIPFKQFFFQWPRPFDKQIGLLISVRPKIEASAASPAAQVRYSTRFDIPKDLQITEIRTRNYAYFAADYDFSYEPERSPDLLKTNAEMTAQRSGSSQPVRLELLPNFLLLRNAPMQKWKYYLLPENALASTLFLLAGLLFELLVEPPKLT